MAGTEETATEAIESNGSEETGLEAFGIIPDPFSALDAAEAAEAENPSTEAEEVAQGDGEDETEVAPEKTEKPTEEETKADEKKESDEEKPVEVAAVPQELQTLFPDAKEIKDVAASISQIIQERDEEKSANNEMVDLLQSHKALIPILRDLRDGKPLFEAIRTRLELGADEEIPDPATDPKAYAEYAKKQIALETRLENEAKQQKENEKKAESARAEALVMKTEFQKANKLSDTDMQKFLSHISTMLYGDPATGKLPKNYLQMMWRTYNYDKDVQAAETKGAISGRNDAIDKMLHKKDVKADGIPAIRSGITRAKVVVDDLSDLEASLAPKPDPFLPTK